MEELLKTCPFTLAVGDADAGVRLTACRRGSDKPARVSGDALRRILPTVRAIVSRVQGARGVPLELHRHLPDRERITFRGGMPLDEEAGYKLVVIFTLCRGVKEMDRVELIARRAERFTREEAGYWMSRLYDYGPDASRFALSGLRVMLGGTPRSAGVGRMLDRVRSGRHHE